MKKNKTWDVGGDTFDSLGDDLEFLEFAELLLEPEMDGE